MARTALAVTTLAHEGALNPVPFVAVDNVNGNKFVNGGRETLLVRNASAGNVTVTVISVPDQAGRTGDLSVIVAAGNIAALDFLEPQWWNQRAAPDKGSVQVDFSVGASIQAAVLRAMQ